MNENPEINTVASVPAGPAETLPPKKIIVVALGGCGAKTLNAFAALPKQEQSILILFCVLELGDGEIGDLMGMSRSAVQRHRTKTLNELQKKLKAHLPEGG